MKNIGNMNCFTKTVRPMEIHSTAEKSDIFWCQRTQSGEVQAWCAFVGAQQSFCIPLRPAKEHLLTEKSMPSQSRKHPSQPQSECTPALPEQKGPRIWKWVPDVIIIIKKRLLENKILLDHGFC